MQRTDSRSSMGHAAMVAAHAGPTLILTTPTDVDQFIADCTAARASATATTTTITAAAPIDPTTAIPIAVDSPVMAVLRLWQARTDMAGQAPAASAAPLGLD